MIYSKRGEQKEDQIKKNQINLDLEVLLIMKSQMKMEKKMDMLMKE